MNIYDLKVLKNRSKSYYKNCEKELLDVYEITIDNYNVGVMMNYIIDKNVYEIYCFIQDKKSIASGLENELIKSKIMSKIYFYYLKKCIENRGLKFFFNL